MLSPRRSGQQGISLVEAMVTLAIAGLLMALAAPAFNNWMQSVRIRSTAESMLSGLQYAKSEAAARNAQVRFQLTSSVTAACALSATGTSWVVDLVDAADDSVAGKCDQAPDDSVAPGILQKRSADEGSGTTRVNASGGTTAVVFNGLGRLVPAPAAAITIDITGADADDCQVNGGELACLQVQISPAGQLRMCNPRFAAGDPQAC